MPIYEYGCNKCGYEFEELVSDMEFLPRCPKCGSTETGKLMSLCARSGSKKESSGMTSSASGCGSCSGGNCASCCGK